MKSTKDSAFKQGQRLMLTIGNVTTADLPAQQRVAAFLAANPDNGVRIRPEKEIEKAIALGMILEVTEDGTTCGASFVYSFETRAKIYREIGTMRIIANGRGLQKLLAQIHLAQAYIEDAMPGPTIFAVVSPETRSATNLASIGLINWQPPLDLVAARADAGLPFDPKKIALAADKRAVLKAIEDLQAAHVSNQVFRFAKGEDVDLRLGWLSPVVLAEVQRDLGRRS